MAVSKWGHFATILLLIALFAGPAQADLTVTRTFCANSTSLNTTTLLDETKTGTSTKACAWGCIQGECLDGTALALNAFLTLLVYLLPTVACILLAYLLDDKYQFTKNALLGMGILIGIIGVIVTMGVYPVASGTMSAIVPSLFSGITAGSGIVVVLVGLMIMVVFIVRKMDMGRIERGEA